ncbi:MAG: glycosyl transferase [Flavobacterium sp.]|nr:MAG: glycosyl transferase [Flavobacterium sp.]
MKKERKNNLKRWGIRAAKITAVLVILLIIGYFAFRNMILHKVIAKIQDKAQTEYNSTFSVSESKFRGIGGVDMTDVTLKPNNADTLFRIRTIKTDINIMKLLVGEIQLENLELNNGFVQLVKKDSIKNFDAFIKNKKDTIDVEVSSNKKDYARKTYRILSRLLNLVPTEMSLKNLSLRINDNGKKASVNMQELHLRNKQLATTIQVTTNTFSQRWRIEGLADPRDRKADVKFFNVDTGAIRVPYFDERYNLKAGFDSVRVNLSNLDMDGGELHVDGSASISNLTINHAKIASKDVKIRNASFNYNLLFGPDFIRVDSTSTGILDKMKFHPFAEYNIAQDTIYKLKINIPTMKAQDFFESLPKGLFSHFEGMQAEGTFDYKLDFMYDKNKPRDIVLKSTLNRHNLKILKFGEANLDKINHEFVYRAIENGKLQRPILVGYGNGNYTPLNQISPYLRAAVLTSEDPSFFSHKGFINEAFKQSIIKNIKTKKFSRGGSTISMQLVKNVFLTREKTLSRKLEEILLVYVLENQRVSSKERMLEVYFNIIEWGPNVYGIGEAARFYFQKHPSELTLKECLFLASIIPSPKKFMWQFDDHGELRTAYSRHQERLTRLMFQRGILHTQDTLYQLKRLMISGPARSYIKIRDEQELIKPDPEMDEFDF